jgi:predicted membrane-bound spermidine synthase
MNTTPHPAAAAPTPYLLLTAFIGGLVTLALELAASRLLAPAFGTTEIVWVAIIGLILLYLSAGSALGGRWADRHPHPAVLYTILVAAGLTIAPIPFLARPLVRLAAQGMRTFNLGMLAGPFAVTLVLFAVPVTLLACVSPFVIRLTVRRVGHSGGTAGRVSAVSTLGSFLGTFLPNLVLIPNLGTQRTFLLLAGIALTTGLVGLWGNHRRRFWLLAWTLIPLALLFTLNPGTIKPQAGLIHEEESTYNFIQVVEEPDGRRILLLNEGQGIHSVSLPPEAFASGDGRPAEAPLALLTGGPWDYFLIAPFFNPAPHPPDAVADVLVIGLAAGTTPTQFTEVYGPLPIDGVEIDPAIVRMGQTYFDMTMDNLDVHLTDGRTYLTTTEHRYSVVAIDAYRLPYIPWHLTTVQFFQQVRDHLRDDGVVAINVGHTPDDWRMVDAMVNTMERVYPSVHVINVPSSLNAIVVATVQPTDPGNLLANRPLLDDPRLHTLTADAAVQIRAPNPSAVLFTDDRAPVEQLTHALALRYILGLE